MKKKLLTSIFCLFALPSVGFAALWGGSAGTIYQADCSTITTGFCVDTDNGNLYVWDGDSVEQLGLSAGDNLGSATAGDVSSLYTGTSGYLYSDGTKKTPTAADLGLGTTDNPSWLSVHASGGNLAAANAQVTKKWITGLSYTADVTSVIHGGQHYICTSTHTAGASTEPGVGASWATVWKVASVGASTLNDLSDVDTAGAANGSVIKYNGSAWVVAADEVGSGSFTYPGAGVPNSTGSAWGTSYTVGTGANNLVQLNGSSQLPAVSAALLTNFPTLNQNTTGTAAGLSGAPNITVGTISAGAGGFSVASDGALTVKSVTTARTTSPSAVDFYEANTESGDNYIRLTLSGPLASTSTVYLDTIESNAALNIAAGTGPTVDAAGEHSVDTTSDQFVYYGGAKRVLTYKKQFDFAIKTPVDADDVLLFKAQTAITITDIHVIAQGGTSISVDIQECDSAGANCATVDAAITADTDGAEDDGTLSNGTIDAGDWVKLVLGAPSGTVNFLTGSIYYVETAD